MKTAKDIPYELVADKLRYDPETGDLYWTANFHRGRIGQKAGSLKKNGYIRIVIGGRSYSAARIAWVLTHGSIPVDLLIDHIDRVRTNNKMSNLRLATEQQNCCNKANQMGEPVPRYYTKHRTGKYQVTIGKKYVGLYETKESATKAVNAYLESMK